MILATCTAFVLWARIVTKSATHPIWGLSIYAPLGMMLIAVALGCAALAQPVQQGNAAQPAHRHASQVWLFFTVLILFHSCVAFFFNRAIPGNSVDTFAFQRDACKSLLQGIDPYGTTQANIYDSLRTTLFYGPGMVVNGRVRVGFQYPPLTLLWALPGYMLGDVRYSYILAVAISALFALAICPDRRGIAVVSVLLLSPLTWLVENRCCTEPLVLMMLSATLYAAVKKRWWLPIALGLFLAAKQYNFLALPLIGYFVSPFQWKQYWKLTGLSVAVGAATALPFVFWNPRGLWHDMVLFHLAQPFRPDAVSFAVPFPVMMKIGPLLLLAFVVWAVQSRRRNTAMFAAAYAIALLIFVSTSKQAFANYYFLIAEALLLSVAALPGSTMKSRSPDTAKRRVTPADAATL